MKESFSEAANSVPGAGIACRYTAHDHTPMITARNREMGVIWGLKGKAISPLANLGLKAFSSSWPPFCRQKAKRRQIQAFLTHRTTQAPPQPSRRAGRPSAEARGCREAHPHKEGLQRAAYGSWPWQYLTGVLGPTTAALLAPSGSFYPPQVWMPSLRTKGPFLGMWLGF